MLQAASNAEVRGFFPRLGPIVLVQIQEDYSKILSQNYLGRYRKCQYLIEKDRLAALINPIIDPSIQI